MASILKVLLEFMCILRRARDYIRHFLGRWASFSAFLNRKWTLLRLRRFGSGKPSTSRSSKPAEPPFLGTPSRGPYSMSSASTSNPSFAERQTAMALAMVAPKHTDRSSVGNLSMQRRANDRLSSSRVAIRVPAAGQPSRLTGATHLQSGRGPDPSRSRDWPPRPPTPTTSRLHTPQHPHLEIITTIPLPPAHGDGRDGPVGPPSVSFYAHEPFSPPPMDGHSRKQSSTSVVVNVQDPSMGSLPISFSANPPQSTEEAFALESATAHPSSAITAEDLRDESPQLSPTASSVLSDYLPEGRFVQLINSDQVPRYTKGITILREETAYDVRPLTTTFSYFPEQGDSEQGSDSSPWIPATHPDGALYFYDRERRLFTDTDMHNPAYREEMEDFYSFLQQVLHSDHLTIPSKNYDLVLDIMVIDDERISWSYYYACHESRCLFWLEPYDASYMISELFGVKSPAHVKHRLESLYWNHWSLFPAVFPGRCLPPDAYDELMGILAHGCVDVMTSKSSTLPYDDDTMQKMIGLVHKAKKAKGGVEYYTAGTTRLLSFFAHWRFLYFHGQNHARLVRGQTVYNKPKRERSILITLLSPLFFLAPEVRLREMEKLWTDELIIQPVWKSFMTKLLGEWEGVILWSTMMLIANMGFLAIPGVVLSNLNGSSLTSASQVNIFLSPTQIASSLSAEANIGSIVIGLLLVRHNRTRHKEDPAGASTYLYRNSHRIFGLEPMAIIFSLPWALLMWSMVIFFVALLLLCYTISNAPTRISVAIMSVLVALLIMWCIRTAWESTGGYDVWNSNLIVLRRGGGDLFKRMKHLGQGVFGPFSTRRVSGHALSTHSMADRQGEVVGVGV